MGLPYITSTSGALQAPCPQPAGSALFSETQATGSHRRLEICTPKAQSEGVADLSRCPAGAWAEGLPRSSQLCRKSEVPRGADFCTRFLGVLFCLLNPSYSEWQRGTDRKPDGAEATLSPAGFCRGGGGGTSVRETEGHAWPFSGITRKHTRAPREHSQPAALG